MVNEAQQGKKSREEVVAEKAGIKNWPEKNKFLRQFFSPYELKFVFETRGWRAFLRMPLKHMLGIWTAIFSLNTYGVPKKKCEELFRASVLREVKEFRANPKYKPPPQKEMLKKLRRIFKIAGEWGFKSKEQSATLIKSDLFYMRDREISEYFVRQKRFFLMKLLSRVPRHERFKLLQHPDLLRMSVRKPKEIQTMASYYLEEMKYPGRIDVEKIERKEKKEEFGEVFRPRKRRRKLP